MTIRNTRNKARIGDRRLHFRIGACRHTILLYKVDNFREAIRGDNNPPSSRRGLFDKLGGREG